MENNINTRENNINTREKLRAERELRNEIYAFLDLLDDIEKRHEKDFLDIMLGEEDD